MSRRFECLNDFKEIKSRHFVKKKNDLITISLILLYKLEHDIKDSLYSTLH